MGSLNHLRGDTVIRRGATPSEIARWADDRVMALGGVPATEKPDARICPACGGQGWTVDHDGTERWCEDCARIGVVRPVEWSCPVCRYGDGWVGSGVTSIYEKGFGMAMPCPACSSGTERTAERLTKSGLPYAFSSWTLETFSPIATTPSRRAAWRSAVQLASDPDAFAMEYGRAGMYLYGVPGSGKTGLAASTFRLLAAHHQRVRWLSWRTWCGDLRTAMKPDSPVTPDMMIALDASAEVLVIDDIGAHGGGETDWRRDVAWRVFDQRYQMHLERGAITIVTSNLDPAAFAAAFTETVSSRMLGCATPIEVSGPDARRS